MKKLNEQTANESKLKMYMNSVKEMFKEQMWKIKTSDTSTKYYDFVKNNQRVRVDFNVIECYPWIRIRKQ